MRHSRLESHDGTYHTTSVEQSYTTRCDLERVPVPRYSSSKCQPWVYIGIQPPTTSLTLLVSPFHRKEWPWQLLHFLISIEHAVSSSNSVIRPTWPSRLYYMLINRFINLCICNSAVIYLQTFLLFFQTHFHVSPALMELIAAKRTTFPEHLFRNTSDGTAVLGKNYHF